MTDRIPATEERDRPRRVAFLFPGQGERRVHESLRFVSRAADGQALCEEAARAADVPLSRLLTRPALLDRTDVLQPVLTAVCLHLAGELSRQGITPQVVLGHSAGEIAAFAAAGAVSAQQAISLSATRGRLMAREAARKPGAMAALATSDPGVIEEALAIGRRAGSLVIASYNAPDETVLSGDLAAISAVLSASPTRATRIPTFGAWHSPAMEGALSSFRAAIDETSTRPLACDVVVNRTGERVGRAGEASGAGDRADLGALLGEQLVRPVMLRQGLTAVRGLADAVVLVGPGAVLRSLWHRNFGRAGEEGVARLHLSSQVDERRQPQDQTNPRVIEARQAESSAAPQARRLTTALFDTEDERSLRRTIEALRGTA